MKIVLILLFCLPFCSMVPIKKPQETKPALPPIDTAPELNPRHVPIQGRHDGSLHHPPIEKPHEPIVHSPPVQKSLESVVHSPSDVKPPVPIINEAPANKIHDERPHVPPVEKSHEPIEHHPKSEKHHEVKPQDNWENQLSIDKVQEGYAKYLNDVFDTLGEQPPFTNLVSQLMKANGSEAHIDNMAVGLEMAHHSIRTKLDEIKRREVDRLNKVENVLDALEKGGKGSDLRFLSKFDREHLDITNPHSFGVEDLKKLVRKIHAEMKLLDQKEQEEFKKYEMEKEHLRLQKLKHANSTEEKEKMIHDYEESKQRHANHEKLHHPGSFMQFMEVWKNEDHLDPRKFDVKTFFNLHDVNSDKRWDENEIEAIMQHELDKLYQQNNTDDDLNERYHEMMRMRREMMEEADRNEDGVISWNEFLAWTNSDHYNADEGWKTEEESDKKPYTDEEFAQYEKEHPDDEHDEEHDESHSEHDESHSKHDESHSKHDENHSKHPVENENQKHDAKELSKDLKVEQHVKADEKTDVKTGHLENAEKHTDPVKM